MTSYTFRIDVIEGTNEAEVSESLYNFLMLYSNEYLITHEIAKITKKSHYHAYAISKSSYEAIKKAWKRKFDKWDGRRQQKAMAICRDPKTYLAYILKDGNVIKSTIPYEEYIGKWKNPKEYGRTLLGKLKKYADDNNERLESFSDCLKVVFNYTRLHGNCMNKYRMKDQAELLYANVDPEGCLSDFLSWAIK